MMIKCNRSRHLLVSLVGWARVRQCLHLSSGRATSEGGDRAGSRRGDLCQRRGCIQRPSHAIQQSYRARAVETNSHPPKKNLAERRMFEAMEFPELIRRARAGDDAASTDLVRRLEPFIERMVRIRMRQRADFQRIRHEFGSSDVCQSVFRSLFRGLRQNRYQFDQPGDLERLVQVIIRFNIATKARRAGVRLRELMEDFEQGAWVQPGPGPEAEVAERDLVAAIQERFAEDELEILTMWLDEVPWAEIGRKLGCSPDSARVRLSRAVVRVRSKLGAEDHAID